MRNSTEKEYQQNRSLTGEEAWRQIMTYIGKNYITIEKQLTEVEKKFPELAEAYRYLGGYIGFLTNRLRMRELRFKPGDTPLPESPDYPTPAEIICEIHGPDSRQCRCAQGDPTACGAPGGGNGGIDEELLQNVRCGVGQKNLTDVLERICQIYQQYKDTSNYTQKDFTNLRRYVQRLIDIQSQLMEQGCYKFELLLEYEPKGYIEVHP